MRKHKLIVKSIEAYRGDSDVKLLLSLPNSQQNAITALQADIKACLHKKPEQLFTADIDRFSQSRSLDANSYMWVLLDKIARAIESTKEEVYQEIVKRVGVWDIFPIKDIAVDDFIKRWNAQGIAYYAERLDNSKLQGYIKVMCYYGSSCYTRAEMARLINEIITQAKELGIETITPAEKERMLKLIKE